MFSAHNHIRRFFQYLRYLFSASSANSIHSPFVFELYVNLIKDETPFYAYDKIEDLRLLMKADNRRILINDLGAGKPGMSSRKIKMIALQSATPAKYGQLLFRLVNKFQPLTILELGTSLGLGTLHLAMPSSKAQVITIEGSAAVSALAGLNFEKLKVKNIVREIGHFDIVLPIVLDSLNKLDFVFFDGNHKKGPTLNYFSQCLKKSHPDTIFVIDDIHWSKEMEEAWEEVKKNESVKVTIDLFFFGIVFFKKELTRQDFVLRY